jgi:hypothetical protein
MNYTKDHEKLQARVAEAQQQASDAHFGFSI